MDPRDQTNSSALAGGKPRWGFFYFAAVTCSCVYTYWAQSMGTLMPVRIWDYLGWQRSFWTIHRYPIKVVCGVTYALLKNIGALVMMMLFVLIGVAYGKAVEWLAMKSWSLGVTQRWNEIETRHEARRDDEILQQEIDPGEPTAYAAPSGAAPVEADAEKEAGAGSEDAAGAAGAAAGSAAETKKPAEKSDD